MKFYLPTLKHLVMQLAKLQIYTLNLTTTFWHCKKNPITFEQECKCPLVINHFEQHLTIRCWTSGKTHFAYILIVNPLPSVMLLVDMYFCKNNWTYCNIYFIDLFRKGVRGSCPCLGGEWTSPGHERLSQETPWALATARTIRRSATNAHDFCSCRSKRIT